MEVEYKDKNFKPDYPFIKRYHIWPFGIVIGYITPVCQCNRRIDNGFEFCETCGYAIPSEKEKKEYNVK